MPTQLQSLIDDNATREPIIRVPSDGEKITSAALADPIVALGRRIEFERQRLNDLLDDPSRRFVVADDFASVVLLGSAPSTVIGDSGPWSVANSSSVSSVGLASTSAAADHPGRVAIASGSSTLMRKLAAVRCSTLRKMLCHVKVVAVGSSLRFEFGLCASTSTSLAETGVNRVSIQADGSVGSNWLFCTGDEDAQTRTDSGIEITVGWHRLEITSDGTDFWFAVDDSSPTVALSNLPQDDVDCFLCVRNALSSFEDNEIDAIYAEFVPGRAA